MIMSWQDNVIGKLNLDGAFVYVISDPDGLAFEPTIASYLQKKNAVFFDETDPFALRITYEKWKSSNDACALLIRMNDLSDLFIPYDIMSEAKYVDFHLSELFHDIDVSVLRLLPASEYQSVIDAISMYRPGHLGFQASTDFLLRHIYRIAPETIQSNTDLVRLLIRKHYIGIEMPVQIENRLIDLLILNPQLQQWNFKTLVPNKTVFFEFLQEQWEMYIQSQLLNVLADSKWPEKELIVPFADSDIRIFIDNLFADGILKPVQQDGLPVGHWAWVGIKKEQEITIETRIFRLLKNAQKAFSLNDYQQTKPEFWLEQSHTLGIMNALFYQNIKQPAVQSLSVEIKTLNKHVDIHFETWLMSNFSKLQTIPTVRYPAMLHRVPDWISRRTDEGKKICLLILDGMGARQWPLIRDHLQTCKNVSLDEHSCFAWVPTITSISRQALFSGKKPFAFAESLLITSKEEQLWRDFWQDKGLTKREVTYAKKVEFLSEDELTDLLASPAIKVAGLVINFIDEQMHGMKMGMAGLNVVIDSWLSEWKFREKISVLLDKGFEIIITADHGNQEAIGIGNINEGVKAATKGERVRIYSDPMLRESCAQACKHSVVAWPGPTLGLPKNTYPLIANSDCAFKSKGETIVGHGGISLHEVIVPFVIINRKQ